MDYGVYTINFLCSSNKWCPLPVLLTNKRLEAGMPPFILFFLLVVEALRKIIHKEKVEGKLKGFRISSSVELTHIMIC